MSDGKVSRMKKKKSIKFSLLSEESSGIALIFSGLTEKLDFIITHSHQFKGRASD